MWQGCAPAHAPDNALPEASDTSAEVIDSGKLSTVRSL